MTSQDTVVKPKVAIMNAVHDLPVLVAPAPGAAEHQVEDKAAGQSAEATGAPATRARFKRFMMLAASVAFAAGFGSFVGSVSGSGLVRLIYPPPAPVPVPASGIENTIAAMHEIKLELAQVACFQSAAIPAHALLGRAVGVVLRRNASRELPLKLIVTNRVGGFKGFLCIAFFDEIKLLLAIMRPHARQIIRLQFGAHRPAIEFFPR